MEKTTSEPSPVQSFQFPDFGNGNAQPNGQRSLWVEYGRTQVPRTELESWQADETIELPDRHESPVALTVDGRLVAHGELVELDGKLGVRVVEVFPRREHGTPEAEERKTA